MRSAMRVERSLIRSQVRSTCSRSICSMVGVRPPREAASTLGVTRSTMSRRKPPGHLAGAHGDLGGLDRAARVVAEHDDERAVEHADAELERAEHAGVDDVAGGAHDEQVAQALVEDDLGGDPGVGAAEEDGERVLLGGDPVPEVHVLVRVGPLVGHEPGVARGEHAPGLLGRAGPRPRLRAVPLDHAPDATSGRGAGDRPSGSRGPTTR